jgi:hypothetical protein
MGLLAGVLLSLSPAHAATPAPAAPSAVIDRAPSWASLTVAQQQALLPLQRDWASIEPNRKQKWIELAAKFPTMPADERLRVQARMADWARLTPNERAGARLQFQETRRLPAEERQERWQAYQALTPEERSNLAQRAKPPTVKAPTGVPEGAAKPRPAADATGAANRKLNIVTPTLATTSRSVAPAVVQARPGATTTTMSIRSAPPPHHQPGLPKIAATPGFVDPATLLPRKGPQGAAVRAAASADPAEQP